MTKKTLESDFLKETKKKSEETCQSLLKDKKAFPMMDKLLEQWDKDSEKKAKGIIKYKGRFKNECKDQEVLFYYRGDKICLVLSGITFIGDDWGTLKISCDPRMKATYQSYPFIQLNGQEFLTKFSMTFSSDIRLMIKDPIKNRAVTILRPLKFEIQVNENDEYRTDIKNKVTLNCFAASDSPPHLLANTYSSRIKGTVNECLQDLKNTLPPTIILQSCWNCGWAYYYPFGMSSFGGLGCLRNSPGWANTKDLMGIGDRWNQKEEDVQETHHCNQWTERTITHSMPERLIIKKKLDLTEIPTDQI